MEDIQESTLREDITANLAAALESAPEPVETPKVEAQPEPQIEQTEAEIKAGRTANRLRDEKGKLLPGVKPAEPEPAVEVSPAKPRPSSWKKEHWGDWDKLSAENPLLADYLHQRERETIDGVGSANQKYERVKPLEDAITPYLADLQSHNINPANWISQMGGIHKTLTYGTQDQKVSILQNIIAGNKIPVQLAYQDQQGNWQLMAKAQPQAPQFDAGSIKQLVEQQVAAKMSEQTVMTALSQFEAEAPTKYPHYQAVKGDMVGLLQAGVASDYASAYDKAVRLHPDLFATVQQQEREETEAKAKAERQAQVNRARSNVSSIRSDNTTGNMKSTEDKSRRQEIQDLLRSSNGRV